jgi:hypothetical protein
MTGADIQTAREEGDLRISSARSKSRHRRVLRTWIAVALAGVAGVFAIPGLAQADNLFTLDDAADSAGPVVSDANGSAYISWERKGTPDTTMFCKISAGGSCASPVTLSPPAQGGSVIGPTPVLGEAANVVYVVGAGPADSDTVVWTSTDGGATFSPADAHAPGSYAGQSQVGDVLRDPAYEAPATDPTGDSFNLASAVAGLGFSFASNQTASDSSPTSMSFSSPGTPIGGATLGFSGSGTTSLPVEAYWTSTAPYQVLFYRATMSGSTSIAAQTWVGPTLVGEGYEPRLAGGPQGLFILTTDIAAGAQAGSQPSVVAVREYDPSSGTFGPRDILTNLSTNAATLFASGDVFENPDNGDLYVVQPVVLGNGSYVMQLWDSSDGGKTFTGPSDIASIGSGYTGIPRIGVNDGGQGWLTFEDASGLEVADLRPLVSASLKLPRSRRLPVKAGAVTVPVACASSRACRVTLQLTHSVTTRAPVRVDHRTVVRTTTKVVTLAIKTFGVPSGSRDRVHLKLNGSADRLLALRSKLKVQALLTATLTGSSTQADLTLVAAAS